MLLVRIREKDVAMFATVQTQLPGECVGVGGRTAFDESDATHLLRTEIFAQAPRVKGDDLFDRERGGPRVGPEVWG
jgi:hypothetical protein